MMRVLVLFQALLLSSTTAFAFVIAPRTAPLVAPVFSKGGTADSSLDVHNLRTLIDNLAPDNFKVSLSLIEPLLMNECVGDECELYLSQLHDKCEEIGMKLPDGFAPTHH